jgi:hypothetical protein
MKNTSNAQPVMAELRDDEGRSLSIAILRRENPNSTDYWDANWLATEIDARGPNFRGACSASILAQELVVLRDRIDEIIVNGSVVEFTSTEAGLTIRVQRTSRGTFAVHAGIGSRGSGEVLELVLAPAWADISRFRDALSGIVEAYAVIGRPNTNT